MKFAASGLLACTLVLPAHSAIIRVPQDQPTIRAGIGAAAAGDTVEVACGTYYESVLSVTQAITLRGASDRAACVVIDAQSSGTVLQMFTTSTAVFEGLTFRNGSSAGTQVFGLRQGTALFRRCAWRDNSGVAGGVWVVAATAEFDECVFEANTSTGRGGGAIWKASRVSDCVFLSNVAQREGGAIFRVDVLENSIFQNNCAMGGQGGAVSTEGPDSIVGCTFVDNTSATVGGALAFESRGGQITDCEFTGNTAIEGGAVYLAPDFRSTAYTIHASSFTRNQADIGGAIYVAGRVASITNTQFTRNDAASYGGGIATRVGSTVTVLRGSFVGNSSTSHGAAITVGSQYTATNLTVRNSIIAFSPSGAPVATLGGRLVWFTCNDVYGNGDGDWIGILGTLEGRDGNFSADPLFCDLSEGRLDLAAGSPCLPGNHPDGATCGGIGALGQGCGTPLRALSLVPQSWGSVKGRYR